MYLDAVLALGDLVLGRLLGGYDGWIVGWLIGRLVASLLFEAC